MTFLLSHWHCIVPVVAILIGVLIMNRGNSAKKKDSEATRSHSANENQP